MSDLEVYRYKRFLLVTKQTKGNSMISAEMELWATKMPYCNVHGRDRNFPVAAYNVR